MPFDENGKYFRKPVYRNENKIKPKDKIKNNENEKEYSKNHFGLIFIVSLVIFIAPSLIFQESEFKTSKKIQRKLNNKEKVNTTTNDNDGEIVVKALPDYSFKKNTVRQLKIRGKYGRYLTFMGRTKVSYKGTDSYTIGGGMGTTSCYGANCTTYYTPPTTIAGTSGGVQHRYFEYELDCVDLTFNRIGDKHTAGGGSYGWMSVDRDPVAKEVSKKYCPKINSLPKKF